MDDVTFDDSLVKKTNKIGPDVNPEPPRPTYRWTGLISTVITLALLFLIVASVVVAKGENKIEKEKVKVKVVVDFECSVVEK